MEIIEVKLDGKPYKTYLDEHGVQRFVTNEAVDRIVDALVNVHGDIGYQRFKELGLYGLNQLAVDYQLGRIPLQDMIDFYTMIGYSVSGFADLSYFEDLEIENPLWS